MDGIPGSEFVRTRDARRAHRVDVCVGRVSAGGAGRHQSYRHRNGETISILTMLAWSIYISSLGALVLMLLPKGNAAAARAVALLAAAAGLASGIAGLVQYKSALAVPGAERIVTVANADWVSSLGIKYHLAADGISLTLALLTGLAAVA